MTANAIPNYMETVNGLRPGSLLQSSGDESAVPAHVNAFKSEIADRLDDRRNDDGKVTRSDVFASIYETTMHELKSGRYGSTQEGSPRIGSKFNTIHCGLYQAIEEYREDLGHYYYPALDLHLTIKRKRDEHASRFNKRRRLS